MENKNLFDQTYSQILSQIGSQAGNFQLIANPIDFSWPVAATGQESLAAYQIMSMSPKWSPIGAMLPGDSNFFSSYRRVFSIVTVKVSPEKQNDLRKLLDEVTTAQNQLNQVWVDGNTAYMTAKQGGGPVFASKYPDIVTWLSGPGSTYQEKSDTLTTAVKKLQDQQSNFLAQFAIDPTLAEDFQLMQTPAGDPGATPAPRGWTKVANADGSLSWQPVFNIATTGQQWRAQLTSGTQGQFTLNLDASKQSSQMDKSWAGGSASYDAVFWSVGGSGSWERITSLGSDSSVTAEIKVQSSALVPVTPGDWYDGGLMKQLARNGSGPGVELVSPWVPKGGPGSQSVFGQYGILSTRVAALLAIYKPSYTINMQSSSFESFQQKIAAGGGLRIGPFSFGGSGGSEKTSYSTSSGRTTLTGQSTSDDPLIIGVSIAFPGLDEA